jgi:hypothetical protein
VQTCHLLLKFLNLVIPSLDLLNQRRVPILVSLTVFQMAEARGVRYVDDFFFFRVLSRLSVGQKFDAEFFLRVGLEEGLNLAGVSPPQVDH